MERAGKLLNNLKDYIAIVTGRVERVEGWRVLRLLKEKPGFKRTSLAQRVGVEAGEYSQKLGIRHTGR